MVSRSCGHSATKTKAGDLAETAGSKAGELGENLLDKTSTLRDAILHSAEGTIDMVKKSETLQKAAETTERIGE